MRRIAGKWPAVVAARKRKRPGVAGPLSSGRSIWSACQQ